MPHPRRSLTRSTLLITSLPKLSKTRTFHMGSPSELRMGVDLGIRPFAAEGSWWVSEDSWGMLLRFSMRSIEAAVVSALLAPVPYSAEAYQLACLAVFGKRKTLWSDMAVSQPMKRLAHL